MPSMIQRRVIDGANSFQDMNYYYEKEQEGNNKDVVLCYNHEEIFNLADKIIHLNNYHSLQETTGEPEDFSTTTSSMKRASTSISNAIPTFPQQKKRNKKAPGLRSHIASTLNFPYKQGLSSCDDFESTSCTSRKDGGIWKDQDDHQAEMLEKHFNSEWQCKFMIEFYGIGGTCHKNNNDDDDAKRGENYFRTCTKVNTAELLNKDPSKDSSNTTMPQQVHNDDKGFWI